MTGKFLKPYSLAITAAATATLSALSLPVKAALYITIVQGLEGEPAYGKRFTEQAHQIEQASEAITGDSRVTLLSGDDATRQGVFAHFSSLSEQMQDNDRIALYLIGHGSFDGETYKFNIPGPDITAEDLNELLTSLPGRNHFILNTSSTSGAMLETLEQSERILITATRNGNERNSTEFGTFFAEALSNTEADVNKNSSISIQEAFDYAERMTADFYTDSGKLATEHPQLRGEQTTAFNIGTVVTRQLSQSDNPEVIRLRALQLEIDARIEELQINRSTFEPAEYTQQLRDLIIESAEVLEQLDALENAEN